MLDNDLKDLIHELRNRIAPIRNATYLLKSRGGSDAQLRETAALIERQLLGMAELLDAASPTRIAAAAAPVAESSEAPEASSEQRVRRILIADDSPAVCESLAAILHDLGHEVRTANDGLEAIDVATAWMADLVLLDINMPKLNGYEAARRLRSKFPSSAMRLVMISGENIDGGVLAAARQAGFDECLDKLLDFAALRRVLQA